MKNVCTTTIDIALWAIEDAIKLQNNKEYGSSYRVKNAMEPLYWYINTGRASIEFLKILVNAGKRQHTTIAKRLLKAETYDEAINSVCQYLKFKRE